MYSKILIAGSSLISVVGTVYAVLSILGLTIEDVFRSITLNGMDERDKELLVQKKQAVTGIPLVVLGWIGQTVFSFVEIKSMCWMIASFVIIFACVLLEILITRQINRKFEINYERRYKKQAAKDEETHKEAHQWHEF